MNELKTPCFIINRYELEKNIQELHNALKKNWNNYIIGYSCKTNSLPWVLNFIKENGCYAEVVSDFEYKLAKKIGYQSNSIVFNGPNKGKKNFFDALESGVLLNIDSWREVEWIKNSEVNHQIKVGVRVNFDLEKKCPGETSFGKDGSRFGFSFENGSLEKAIKILNSVRNVKVVGIHIHNTAKTRSLNIYKELSKKACEVAKLFDYELEYVDIGGGFFGGVPGKPSFDDYMNIISYELSKKFTTENTKLIVEPGSAIIASPVKFICEVVDVKDTFAKRIVTINGGRHNVDPLMIKSDYFLEIMAQNTKYFNEQIICGYTCLENDRLLKLINKNELSIGDKLIFNKVGAYTMALSPLFIEYFPSVYVDLGNNNYKLVRERWEVEEYIQKSILD
ncbi:pyridoxal-dependent decarboxylase [Clostridium perfringens]|uniref:pyridoxal-dependent decarboxylase n=1 Tax=Clostridium perfringens TaxID=1502 RepID=UPI0018E48F22|nr:pyridoxal-dependent decarboxylase [Clostridium perfringens]MBI6001464.1 pyridoxal-dependent decarboxylase [Clostridium perfringens]MDK0557885.1 pyridoxal-dependent decarboxylase [Clostridium perfringens]MDZ4956705.1 pyridoxal-dependent decarboxylase [Clostridium perfringens]